MMLCEKDGIRLSHKKSVFNHNKLHLTNVYECDMCPRKFSTLRVLKQHIKNTHTDTLYPCNECNETFKIKDNLKRHIVDIHQNIKSTCDFCSKKFREDYLSNHKKHCSRGMKTKEDTINNHQGGYQNIFKQYSEERKVKDHRSS